MFGEVKGNFGFGCMRLPMENGEVDKRKFCEMIDRFIAEGFNYFDTAKGYVQGKSETAISECLVSRYPRESFVLTDKLTGSFFKTEEDVRTLFLQQLARCGTDYFDFYLMHSQNAENFEHFKNCRAYEQALEFKKEGKIKHFGISFHDKADVLDKILLQYPQIEVVQIQFNYVDYDDVAVQSQKCYEVCVKHNMPVIVMEPVKGGNLAKLPKKAAEIIGALHGGSPASYALRFAAGFDGVFMTLSGMSDTAQMEENLSVMKNFKLLNKEEAEAVEKVKNELLSYKAVQCTACRYCVDGCPAKISIPDLFACYNSKSVFHDWNANFYYEQVHTKSNGKASACLSCGKCEKVCPQHLPVRKLLKDVAKEFEK